MLDNQMGILLLSLLLEGALSVAFFCWAAYRDYHFALLPELWELGYGVVFTIPLLILNFTLFSRVASGWGVLRSLFEFREDVVKPLVQRLDFGTGLVVSICAGIGEELFFRGVLDQEFGILVASICFSLLHFGRAVGRYLLVAIVYALIGVYFSLVFRYFLSLWVVITAHALYDYIALIHLKMQFSKQGILKFEQSN